MQTRSSLLEHYSGRRAEITNNMEAITALAFNRPDKALTDQDREALTVLQSDLEKVTKDIEQVSVWSDMSERAQQAIARVQVGAENQNHTYRSEGDALWDVLHRSTDEKAAYRLTRYAANQERAAEHMGLDAANTVPVAGGFNGLVVNPILGPVVSLYPQTTPFLTLIGPRQAPAGKFLLRPRLIDPNLLTAAGPPAGGKEKAEMPSKSWNWDTDAVPMNRIGNYINLSYDAIEWVPSALQSVIDHLRLRTSLAVEAAVVEQADATGAVVPLAADATAAALQAAIWDAYALVFQTTGQPATWLVAGPLGTSMLGSKTDTTERAIFPVNGPLNAQGSADGGRLLSPFGLNFVQTPAIADTSLYVGNGTGLEAYVRWHPTLQADEPSVFGRQIGVAASVGFFNPVTAEPDERNAIVKIGTATP